jgi:5-methylcytosine-specific restriction endonuclease McrA
MQKQCCTCKIIKDISEFSRDNKKNGFQCECKTCNALYYKDHKDKIAKQMREYYKGHKDKIAKQQVEYRKEHKVEIAKNYKDHKDEIAEQQRAYFQTDNGRMAHRRGSLKRRALKKNPEATLTAKQWAYILEKQNNRCNNCGKKFFQRRPPTMDHIIPLSHGGSSTSDNIQALCRSCNSSKNAKLDLKYIQVWNA